MAKHHIRIARSGVQYYLAEELPALGLNTIPRECKGQKVFGVYRPSYVLDKAAGLFQNVPVRVGHHTIYDASDPAIIGRVCTKIDKKFHKGEVTLTSEMEIDDETRIPKDWKELSPGYFAKNHWAFGQTPSGEVFDIVCDEIYNVNHLALVPEARGGKEMLVLDGVRKIHSGLLRFLHRKEKPIEDGQTDAFANICMHLLANRQNMTDEEIQEQCTSLLAFCQDLPSSDEKDKLVRYIADIPLLKMESAETAETALQTIISLYGTLDQDAVTDIMETTMPPKTPIAAVPPAAHAQPTQPTPQAAPAPAAAPAPQQCPNDPMAQINAKLDKLISLMSASHSAPSQNAPSSGVNDASLASVTPSASAAEPKPIGDAALAQTPATEPATEPTQAPVTDSVPTQAPEPQTEPAQQTAPAEPTTAPVTDGNTVTTTPVAQATTPEPQAPTSPVTDGTPAPLYTQSMSAINQANALDEMFEQIKRRQ